MIFKVPEKLPDSPPQELAARPEHKPKHQLFKVPTPSFEIPAEEVAPNPEPPPKDFTALAEVTRRIQRGEADAVDLEWMKALSGVFDQMALDELTGVLGDPKAANAIGGLLAMRSRLAVDLQDPSTATKFRREGIGDVQ